MCVGVYIRIFSIFKEWIGLILLRMSDTDRSTPTILLGRIKKIKGGTRGLSLEGVYDISSFHQWNLHIKIMNNVIGSDR